MSYPGIWLIGALLGLIALVPIPRAAAASPGDGGAVSFLPLADRLLREEFGLSCTNIPVSPTNGYTPGVHRILQVAANIVDATRTNILEFLPGGSVG